MEQGFRMSVGAHAPGVGEAKAAFVQFAELHDLPADVRRSLLIALDELLANSTSHGVAGRVSGSVTLEVVLDQGRLMVTFTDDGPPFDPFDVPIPNTAQSLEDRTAGGLGIHLVRHLVDEFSYERRDDRNVVVLVRRLRAGQAEGPHGAS